MSLVVLNADDLGLSAEVNEGTARAAARGLVSEASLLVTLDAAEEGARTGLASGLHLCLTEGRSLTGRIPGLTDRTGRFRRLPAALAACFARVPPRDDVRREVLSQLARARALGATVDHLNGHEHAHLLPVVRDVVIEVARTEGIAHVRVPGAAAVSGPIRGAVVARLAAGFRRAARGSGLRTLPVVGRPQAFSATAGATEVLLHAPRDHAMLDWCAELLARGFRPARYAETGAFSETL